MLQHFEDDCCTVFRRHVTVDRSIDDCDLIGVLQSELVLIAALSSGCGDH